MPRHAPHFRLRFARRCFGVVGKRVRAAVAACGGSGADLGSWPVCTNGARDPSTTRLIRDARVHPGHAVFAGAFLVLAFDTEQGTHVGGPGARVAVVLEGSAALPAVGDLALGAGGET